MIVNKQIKLIVVLVVSVIIGACLSFLFGKRTEGAAETVSRPSGSITNVIEKAHEASSSSNAMPTMVDAPTEILESDPFKFTLVVTFASTTSKVNLLSPQQESLAQMLSPIQDYRL